MADFLQAVKITLSFEGGFVDDPADPGGATNFGITQKDLPDIDIRSLTEQQAIAYYQEHYWKPFYSEINSQAVAWKIFDAGVNIGVGTAVKILQGALGIEQDGAFGPNTLFVTNEQGDALLEPFKAALCQHYQNLVGRNPLLGKFLHGWLRRAIF
jgi:lysozyme family protein